MGAEASIAHPLKWGWQVHHNSGGGGGGGGGGGQCSKKCIIIMQGFVGIPIAANVMPDWSAPSKVSVCLQHAVNL